MTVMAYYGTRNGGSGGRAVASAAEAEKILKGGYGVTTVRLVDAKGDEVGRRWRFTDKWGTRWLWHYETDAFNE